MELRTARKRKAVHRGFLNVVRTVYQKFLLRPYLHLAGLMHLRRGRLPAAESCFCRAALISPRSFNTRVQLGRVYFLMEEFFKAEQQFLKAQEIDPKRFHRSHLPDNYTCWEEMESGEDQADSIFGDYEAEGSLFCFDESGAAGAEEADPSGSFRYGDFSTFEEWQRFQGMPPISPSEIKNTDWDSILSDPTL